MSDCVYGYEERDTNYFECRNEAADEYLDACIEGGVSNPCESCEHKIETEEG